MEITGEGSVTLPPKDIDDRISSVPWSKCCVEGCDARTADGGREVIILLPCLHAICSDQCSERFLGAVGRSDSGESSGGGEGLLCNVCKSTISREQLANKVNVKKEFSKVGIALLCEFCVYEKRAVSFCPDCPSLLCDDCTKLHPGFKLSQGHIRLTSDLTQQENEAQAKLSNCARHPAKRPSHYCVNCEEQLCQVCVGSHVSSHKVMDIRKERNELESNLNVARALVTTCDTAVSELAEKQEELKYVELAQVKDAIKKEFSAMLKALQKEAEGVVMKHVGALEDNKGLAESVKSSANEFIKAGEAMLSDGMEFTAVANFLRHSQTHRQSLFQQKDRLTNEEFVGKDWHFQFKRSDNIQAFLRNVGHFEYPHQPQENRVEGGGVVEPGAESPIQIATVENLKTTPAPVAGSSKQGQPDLTPIRRSKRPRPASSRRVSEETPASASKTKSPRLERDLGTQKRKAGRGMDESGSGESDQHEVSADFIDRTIRNYPEAPSAIELEVLPPKHPKVKWTLRGLIECFLKDKKLREQGKEEAETSYCFICILDKKGEEAVCCDFCPKMFHFDCHIPPIPREEAENDEEWRCNSCSERMELPLGFQLDVKNRELSEENENDFRWASKFLMECYKIPESGSVRWEFPEGYRKRYGRLPYHLKYIRERLFSGDPEQRFKNVMEMMSAFEQMFTQALVFYKNDYQVGEKWNAHRHAVSCFKEFLKLVEDYYPQCLEEEPRLFQNVLKFGTSSAKSKAPR